MKIGLQKNLKLDYTNFSVDQLQFWGFEAGIQKLEVGLYFLVFFFKLAGGRKLDHKNLNLAYTLLCVL